MNRMLASAEAGFAATVPMTAFMLAAHKALPGEENKPVAPSEVTDQAAKKVGAEEVSTGMEN